MAKRIIDLINKRMPHAVKKTGKEYEAIWGKTQYTENETIESSADYNCGAIANELEYLRAYINRSITSMNLDQAEEELLDKIITFFLNISRIYDETDTSLRKRFFAFIRRLGNKRWSTTWSFKDVFSYFFNPDNIYVIENYIEDDDQILNGDFENVTEGSFDNWSKYESGSSVINVNTTEMFQEAKCPEFSIDSSNSEVSLSQTISSVSAGDYKLSLFYKDDEILSSGDVVKLTIQRSGDNYYYNFDTLSWQAAAASKELPIVGDYYRYAGVHVKNEDTRNLTLKIANAGSAGTAYKFYVDRVKFGEWKTYPSVKVLIVCVGEYGVFLSLWPGTSDPIGGGEDYQYASFFENDFIAGMGMEFTETLYQDILSRIKEAGSKSDIEFIHRNV